MKFTKRFHMIRALTFGGLEKAVNDAISSGYVPCGGTTRYWGKFTQSVFLPDVPARHPQA